MNEKALIQRSQAGDEKAFEELITLHKGKVFAHVYSLLKDESSAEDVMQETLIAASRKIGDFQQKSSFGTWLWRIAHNKTISWLRKQKGEEEFREELLYLPDPVVTIDKESYEEILALLPEKQRECYRLFMVEQKTQKEIAEQLHIPYGTVRSRIHYARKRLQILTHLTRN